MNLRNLNLAEGFALSRLVTFPLMIALIFFASRPVIAWSYLLFFSTDVLDGFFAHFFGMESQRRSKLDSTGDVLYFFAGLIGFYVLERDYFHQQIIWLSILAFFYLLQFGISMVKFGRPSSFHTYSAKLAAFFHFLFLTWMFFFSPSDFLFFVAFVWGIIESIDETLVALHVKSWNTNLKGIYFIWMKERKRSDPK
jgi:CDP-diacylglycerol--glycerol-3-phosphate 3-phosphatidyltransferase